MNKLFVQFANAVAEGSGYPSVFGVAILTVVVWLACLLLILKRCCRSPPICATMPRLMRSGPSPTCSPARCAP